MDRKTTEEDKGNRYEGFRLGPAFKHLEHTLEGGDWTRDVAFFFGGKPNTGKTGVLCHLAYSIALNNEDVTVIYHSIDGTRDKILPRFVAIADESDRLMINQVSNPGYWASRDTTRANRILSRREHAYDQIIGLARDEKLVLKDANNGSSLKFTEDILSHYSGNSKRVVYVLDNFHKLRDMQYHKDERVKWKALSQQIKALAERYHVTIICSIEYHKIARGVKPSNYNIAESQQLEYDGDLIIHLYNEVADKPDEFEVFHRSEDFSGKELLLPRLEIIVGKNKISERKETFFLDFYPDKSKISYVDRKRVLNEKAQAKRNRSLPPPPEDY